jgi:cytochrome c oxidase subunit 1
MFYALLFGARQNAANPWNEYADTLEWTLPSPPPEHTFEILPEQKDWDKSRVH